MSDTEQTMIVRGLLDIARVAQPPDIFAVDPRVRRALEYLGGRTARTPDVARDPVAWEVERIMGEPAIDIGAADPNDPVTLHLAREMAFQDLGEIVLDSDLVQPLAAAQASILPPAPAAALNAVVRDWLIGHGFLEGSRVSRPLGR